jgi:hypothetical protein
MLTTRMVVAGPDIDPFATAKGPNVLGDDKPSFTTTGFYKIIPNVGISSPDKVRPEDWPHIANPTSFNRHFDGSPLLWRVAGGYFAAFDGGEWGGALFYRNDKDKNWKRVIGTHIQVMQEFDEDIYLATGGLSHLDMTAGAAYIITRKSTGRWTSKKVFNSRSGIPCIVGVSETEDAPNSERLIVLTMGDTSGFVGISHAGTVYYLGSRQPGEAGADQPATKPADNPPVNEQPLPPTSKDPTR